MGRTKKPLPLIEGVTIEATAAEGNSLFHWNDMVVFVPWCVPGDVCDVQLRRKKHSFAEGEVVRFVSRSSVRTEPFCEHFGVCGGCRWQMLPYEEQLRMKQQQVEDQLRRIGKVELPPIRPILGSVKTREYRNKLDFACANKRYLTKEQIRALPPSNEWTSQKDWPSIGFHISGAFDKVLPITRCWLMDPLNNQIRNALRDTANMMGMDYFDLREQTGLLRDVIIRNSASGEWMVIVQFHFSQPLAEGEQLAMQPGDPDYALSHTDRKGSERSKAYRLLKHIADIFPQITSLMYVDNQKCNDTFGDLDIRLFKGQDHITELMEDLRFKVGPKSFYQTNTEQACHLYSVVREFAELGVVAQDELLTPHSSLLTPHSSLIYDLYTGTGTIANFVARRARQVIGIEYVPEAIEDAKENSRLNGIDNTLFFAGDMKDILTDEFIERHGRPDVIITDPPRAGMHPDVVRTILRAAPERIVYVSCNPATQARDLQMLDEAYRVQAVQPVDMFPHTPHVENVVLLTKK